MLIAGYHCLAVFIQHENSSFLDKNLKLKRGEDRSLLCDSVDNVTSLRMTLTARYQQRVYMITRLYDKLCHLHYKQDLPSIIGTAMTAKHRRDKQLN